MKTIIIWGDAKPVNIHDWCIVNEVHKNLVSKNIEVNIGNFLVVGENLLGVSVPPDRTDSFYTIIENN